MVVSASTGALNGAHYASRPLAAGFTGLLITRVALALMAAHPIPVMTVVFLLGLAGFGANPRAERHHRAAVQTPRSSRTGSQ